MRHPYLDAHEIVPNLWQGSFPIPGTTLQRAGFKVLVLCASELQFEEDTFPGLNIIRAPNEDSKHLSRLRLRIALAAAKDSAKAIRAGQRVLVTCAAGLNRSGLVSALTLHALYGWSGPKCIQQVQQKRVSSLVCPDLTALCNPKFVEVLSRLKEMKRKSVAKYVHEIVRDDHQPQAHPEGPLVVVARR